MDKETLEFSLQDIGRLARYLTNDHGEHVWPTVQEWLRVHVRNENDADYAVARADDGYNEYDYC